MYNSKMSGIIYYFSNKLGELRANGDEEARSLMLQDYGILLYLGCFYPKIDPLFLKYSVFQFLYYATVLGCAVIFLSVTMFYSYADSNIEQTTQILYLIIVGILALYMLVILNIKRRRIAEMYSMFIQECPYDDVEGLNVNILEENAKVLRKYILKFAIFYSTFFFACLFSGPFIDNSMGRHVKPVKYCNSQLPMVQWTPFDSTQGLGYVFALFLEISVAFCGIFVMAIAILGCLIFNQRIRENLQLLNYCIEHVEERSINTFNKRYPNLLRNVKSQEDKLQLYKGNDFEECYLHSLKLSVKHHQFTMRMSFILQEIGSWALVYILFIGPILIATATYALMSGSPSISYKIGGVMISIIAILSIGIICWYGEELKSLSQKNVTLLYFIPWEERCPKVRRTINLIQTMSQKQITPMYSHLKISIDLHTFKEVINAAYTYVTFIYTLRSANQL